MKYRPLGETGLQVPLIGLGTMTWGEQNNLQQACEQMDYALSRGVNLFDVAEMYPVPPRPETVGETERCVGEWLAQTGKRSEVILATKVTGRADQKNSALSHIRGGARLSRDHIRQAMEGSLERMQTDYIDLYQVHWPERATNFFGARGYSHNPNGDGIAIEETLRALAELVDEGLIKHIGISNETPWGTMEYLRLAAEQGLPKVGCIQNVYNLLSRQFETGLAEMSIREDVPLLAYSPMAFGMLSGKYLDGNKPSGARLTLFDRFTRYDSTQSLAATEAYAEIAERQGMSLAQMSLAFVCQQPFVASCLIGATTMTQLKENIDAVDITLSDAVLAEIEAVHNCYPDPAP
ncbi:MAG: General stress protein 69 [Cellvibrionales bacterium UBA7375]|nr:NADP(H)-dependent aldo-keto reductase [Gammaproteobacteria bacterium]CAI8166044.1 MAG: General stress protein 69 [Cellvibrionales bacterium UBA7375]